MLRRIVPALVAAAMLAGCGDGDAAATPQAAADALRVRLEGHDLSIRSIACVASDLPAFDGATAYRCTVDFGDPHLVPYCAALVEGELVTDRERPELRCYRAEDEERYRAATVLDGGG